MTGFNVYDMLREGHGHPASEQDFYAYQEALKRQDYELAEQIRNDMRNTVRAISAGELSMPGTVVVKPTGDIAMIFPEGEQIDLH